MNEEKKKKYNFVLDVDGVLTDGSFLYDANGKAYKRFGADDADALKLISDQVNIVFVSADHRGFPITKKRVEDMGFPIEQVKSKDRLQWIHDKFGFENTFYMGDSFEDIPMLEACIGIAPNNALPDVLSRADYVCGRAGGDRAVAEACIWINSHYLRGRSEWPLREAMKEHGYKFIDDITENNNGTNN